MKRGLSYVRVGIQTKKHCKTDEWMNIRFLLCITKDSILFYNIPSLAQHILVCKVTSFMWTQDYDVEVKFMEQWKDHSKWSANYTAGNVHHQPYKSFFQRCQSWVMTITRKRIKAGLKSMQYMSLSPGKATVHTVKQQKNYFYVSQHQTQ